MTTWTIVVPSNRAEELQKFIDAWTPTFIKNDAQLVIMWDGEVPPTLIHDKELAVTTLSWGDVKAQYIPKKTDMIRSWAFKWAYDNTDSQYFLTLDDDVSPNIFVGDVLKEYEKVFQEGAPLSEYLDVGALTTSNLQMRGFPYKDRKKREVAVQYGGWSGVLDYDAATQISQQPEDECFSDVVIPVPKGAAVTCCIMNCAWKRDYTPIMWQLPMLDGRYNRVGDIWSGLFIKKTLDAVGAVMVINGRASVDHQRASNVYNSLVKEAPSVLMNDNLWEALSTLPVPGLMEMYSDVTTHAAAFFEQYDKEYAEHFLKARDEWLSLW